jgi:glycerophosphoryl diester phosphodiesterase
MRSFLIPLAAALMLVACVAQAQERGLVFAHRGGAHEFDENTLVAFKESYARGLRGFETDVRMTRDGVLVIPVAIYLWKTENLKSIRLGAQAK